MRTKIKLLENMGPKLHINLICFQKLVFFKNTIVSGNLTLFPISSEAMGLSGAGRRAYMKLFTAANYSSFSASNEMNLIKQLRERTSAPIKDVKAALVDSNWDIDAAQKELRKRGVVLASKKSSRTASEGLLALAQNHHKTALIELNCETDFVARNDIFQHLALSLANQALLLDNNSSPFHFGPQSFQVIFFSFNALLCC